MDQEIGNLMGLLAVCVGRCADAHSDDWTTPAGAECTAANVARTSRLDMRSWWAATDETYLRHVPKALIVEAVREAKGANAGRGIATLKKEPMVASAAELLAGTGWLPMKLRTSTAGANQTNDGVALIAAE